jgi:CheY-like chemotaxis protein
MSWNLRTGDTQSLADFGFVAHLNKPVRQSQLHACLVKVLGGATTDGVTTDEVTTGEEAMPVPSPNPPQTLTALAAAVDEPSTAFSPSPTYNARVLLAEDNLVNQKLAMRILEKMGFQVEAVNNGDEAIHALEKTFYDIVLMDVQMPIMDGLAATQAIRAGYHNLVNPHIPIIAMTAHALKGDRERCLEAGMDDYVAKPIQPEALIDKMVLWLGNRYLNAGHNVVNVTADNTTDTVARTANDPTNNPTSPSSPPSSTSSPTTSSEAGPLA